MYIPLLIRWLIVGMLASLTAYCAPPKDLSIRFVNYGEVFDKNNEKLRCDTPLKAKAEADRAKWLKMNVEIDSYREVIKDLREKEKDSNLTDKARKKIDLEINEVLQAEKAARVEIRCFAEDSRNGLNEMGDRLRKVVDTDIRIAVKKYAAANAITTVEYYMIDRATGQTVKFDVPAWLANPVGGWKHGKQGPVTVDPRFDVTQDIIKVLNQGHR